MGQAEKIERNRQNNEDGEEIEDLHPHELGEGAKGDGSDAMHVVGTLPPNRLRAKFLLEMLGGSFFLSGIFSSRENG